MNYGRESGSSLKPLLSTPWTPLCTSGWAASVFFVDLVDRFYLGVAGDPLLRPLYPDDLARVVSSPCAVPDAVLGWPRDLRRGARPSPAAHAPCALRHRPGGARRLVAAHARLRCRSSSRRPASPRRTRWSCAATSRWPPTRSSTPPDRPESSVLEVRGAPFLAGRHRLLEVACGDADEELRRCPPHPCGTAGCWRRGCSRAGAWSARRPPGPSR